MRSKNIAGRYESLYFTEFAEDFILFHEEDAMFV
jgi:hypothetical protein